MFIAEAAASAERGPQYKPTDASRAAQAAHLERLKAMGRYPGCTFASPDNLAKHILSSAILDLLVENIVVQTSGSGADVDIQAGRPYLRLTQYERRTKLATRDNSEVALLSAYRADVVPLIGRDRELSELATLARRPGPDFRSRSHRRGRARQDAPGAGACARVLERRLARRFRHDGGT